MHPRTLLLLVIGFIGGLTAASCTPVAVCTSATCGGCCDAMDKCQSGATSENCGISGASCGRCGTGTVCQSGECRAGMATGGGGGAATGGGSGGGGGAGCRQITMLATMQSNLYVAEYRAFTMGTGHYNLATWSYLTATLPESFRLEVVYPNDVFPTFPYTEFFSTATRYRNCIACGIFYEGCNTTTMNCAKSYLAQGGSIRVDRADRAPAGRITGTASNLTLNEWNLDNDVAEGTGCVTITTVGPWNVGWNADGGMLPP